MAKKRIFAVAVTPDRGLEVAEMDYSSGVIVKYAQRALDVVTIRSVIPDMDVFKDLLKDCLTEVGAPKGSGIVLSLPTVSMGLGNYMSSQTDASIVQLIENDLMEKELLFRDNDPLVVTTGLSVTVQSKVVAYTAAVFSIVQEAATMITDLGYTIHSIDSSVAAVFRALVHTGKIQPQGDGTWLMMLVDNSHARIMAFNGESLVEYKEEQLLYDVSDPAGNSEMVASAMSIYLEKLPAKYLFIVSRADAVSAEMLASKVKYNNPIIFLEANSYAKEGFIDVRGIPEDMADSISLDLIGACLYDESLLHFNMFVEALGNVYEDQQPAKLGSIALTNAFCIKMAIFFILPILGAFFAGTSYLGGQKAEVEQEISAKKVKIEATKSKIKELESQVSSDEFSEGDQIKLGVSRNTEIFNYFDILGREMPQKLWLTYLSLAHLGFDDKYIHVDLEGQADNIESIYAFYRNLRENIEEPTSSSDKVKLQKLALAKINPPKVSEDFEDGDLPENGLGDLVFNENSNDIILSSNADFYEYIISNKSPKELERMKAPKDTGDKKKKNRKKKRK